MAFPPAAMIVFDVFDGAAEGGIAAGDEADDHGGIGAEGGRAFGSVEYAQAAGGSGSDVEEAATFGEGLGDEADGLGDGGGLLGDGGDEGGIFTVHKGDGVIDGEGVELGAGGVGEFGEDVGAVADHGGSVAV